LIFQPIIPSSASEPQPYLVYAQRFDCNHAASGVNKVSGLFRLKRAKLPNGKRLGAVVEAGRIRAAVDVQPYFGREVDPNITCTNALEICRQFNLNKYCDKETFQLLRE